MLRLPLNRFPRSLRKLNSPQLGAFGSSGAFNRFGKFGDAGRSFSAANTSNCGRISTWKHFQNALFNCPAIELMAKQDGDTILLSVKSTKNVSENASIMIGARIDCPQYKKNSLLLEAYVEPPIPFVKTFGVRIPSANFPQGSTKMVMDKFLVGCDEKLSVGKSVATFKRSLLPLSSLPLYCGSVDDPAIGEGILQLLGFIGGIALSLLGFACGVALVFLMMGIVIYLFCWFTVGLMWVFS